MNYDKIHYGERQLMCAIIESAITAFLTFADEFAERESEHFKATEQFLFGNGEVKRIMLRDPETGRPFDDGREEYVDCSLKKLCDALTINGQPLSIPYIRQGVLKRLEKKRNEKNSQELKYRWTPSRY